MSAFPIIKSWNAENSFYNFNNKFKNIDIVLINKEANEIIIGA